eukprot:4567999-Amphidinium_carterae.1
MRAVRTRLTKCAPCMCMSVPGLRPDIQGQEVGDGDIVHVLDASMHCHGTGFCLWATHEFGGIPSHPDSLQDQFPKPPDR